MKLLSSSLRSNQRYIAFEVFPKTFSFDELVEVFEKELLSLMGEDAFSRANAWFIKNLWNEKRGIGIVRVCNGFVIPVKVALSLVKRASRKGLIVRTGKVYGTIRKFREVQ
jgi:RNase P/RNase MRP subunit POP5